MTFLVGSHHWVVEYIANKTFIYYTSKKNNRMKTNMKDIEHETKLLCTIGELAVKNNTAH